MAGASESGDGADGAETTRWTLIGRTDEKQWVP
jgi:hypothetical protein